MTEQKQLLVQEAAAATAGETRAHLFPQYLMKLLNDEAAPEALWWLPDGLAFALDPQKITVSVLDKHFQKTKYSSFIRRLHNEGYRRQTRKYKKMEGLSLPEGTVVLSHDLFQKDKPQLLEAFYKKSPPQTAKATNTSDKSLVREAIAKLDASTKMNSPRTTSNATSEDVAAAASVLGLSSSMPFGMTGPYGAAGIAGIAPNLAVGAPLASAFGMDRRSSLSSSFHELRQARMDNYLMAQSSMGMEHLLASYGNSNNINITNLLAMTKGSGDPPMRRSNSGESAATKSFQLQVQQQQQASEEAALRNLMLHQQAKQLNPLAASVAGATGSSAGSHIDSQVSRLHQLELETRRRRLELEQEQAARVEALHRFNHM